jgi:penicillin G amidase
MVVLRIKDLDGPVEMLRDHHGVPHCFAVSERDAFLAQGFAHAADRLWQMDYDRRRGLGRWAEVAGEPGVVSDTFYRRMDLAATVQRDLAALGPAARDMLRAYAAGVNAAIEQVPRSREFRVTGTVPEPWAPWHSLLVFRVRHLAFGSAPAKLWRAVVAEALGPEAARKMAGGATGEEIAILPPGARCRVRQPAGLGADDGGSNNWVLAGSRTASGLPLLAGDPHRTIEVPGVYAQGHVACPEWDALGVAMPGVPGFSHFGHNARVAWSITHGMIDDQDLYRYDATPPTTASRVEVIEVRGAGPVTARVSATERGPLIADNLALAWTATVEPNRGFDALPAMLRARTVPELFEAMRGWTEPGNNLLAADTDGTIGYLTRGRVPVRSRPEAAWVPVPGDDPSYGWRGWLAFDDLPRALNPDTAFLFSTNNRIEASGAGPYFGLDVAPPWRAARITSVLSGLTAATVADMEALHRDVVSLPGQRIAALLAGWAPLAGWDGAMTADSPAAGAYSALRRELALILLERSGLAAHVDHPWNRLVPGMRAESILWRVAGDRLQAGDPSLLGGWSWEQALRQAVAGAERAWHGEAWGDLHATRLRHPLGRPELDPPSVPYGGDMETVQASTYVPADGLATVGGSVARYAFDVADWDRSGWVVPLGADGEPGAPHFRDQQEAWRTGRLVPALYSRPAVQAAAEEVIRLTPP